jgi:hypothetical protein
MNSIYCHLLKESYRILIFRWTQKLRAWSLLFHLLRLNFPLVVSWFYWYSNTTHKSQLYKATLIGLKYIYSIVIIHPIFCPILFRLISYLSHDEEKITSPPCNCHTTLLFLLLIIKDCTFLPILHTILQFIWLSISSVHFSYIAYNAAANL